MATSLSRNIVFALVAGTVGSLILPAIKPAVSSKGRPAAKEAVRAGLLIYEKAREIVGEWAETASDIIAEVQAEMELEREAMEASEPADGEQVVPFEPRSPSQPERKLYG